jgi:mannose-6-phosphate isomerase
MTPNALVLQCQVQTYDWGSTTFIPSLLGAEPDGQPQAELWMGAHPGAPSQVNVGGREVSLADVIAGDPVAMLGADSLRRFGAGLPFLMKVLSAAKPLSLQAHPSRKRAMARFAEEDAAGVDRASPFRSYRDPNHKPELICALTEFEALCGFRSLDETLVLLKSLDGDGAQDLIAVLSKDDPISALRSAVEDLLRGRLDTAAIIAACREAVNHPSPEALAGLGLFRWCVMLADQYPGDAGAVISLLMNYVVLQPGEALSLPSGNLHAYLRGSGIELMANSDNVLRGGLTSKHIDVDELLAVVDWMPLIDPVIRPMALRESDGVATYPSPSDEFVLHHIEVSETGAELTVAGPEILICVRGSASVAGVAVVSGTVAFVPASTGHYSMIGDAELYRATVG